MVAALLAGRRSMCAGIVAALLFAITPTAVVFGSEARGYAMMLLAALTMLLMVSDVIEGRPARNAPAWLALIALLGMLSHLTMAAAVAIATLWVYLEWRAERGPAAALSATRTLMAPALAATAAVAAFVFIAAALSPLGLRVGGYQPFSALLYITALDDLSLWTIGLGTPWPWLVPICLCALSMMILVRGSFMARAKGAARTRC